MQKAQTTLLPQENTPRRRNGGINRKELKQIGIGLAFISPWIIGFLAFKLYPILASAYYSLTRYTPISSPTFIGLANYNQLLFHDDLFRTSVVNTLYFVALYVPLSNLIALGLAALLNTKIAGIGIFRTIFYLPSILPTVAISVVWIWLLHPQYGILSGVLSLLHLPPINWFNDPAFAKMGLVLMSLWGVGWMMVTYLAALQDVPTEYYEAASLDGASPWTKFLRVTVPLISPVILFNVVICLINAFQYFTEPYIITQGGPSDSTLFYSLYLFKNAFTYFKMGYASAQAWILFVIILLLTALIFRTSARRVYYQDG
jgi:multiple sugar transport system permease protein